MLYSDKGHTKISGSGMDLLNDLILINRHLCEAIKRDFGEEVAEEVLTLAKNAALLPAEDFAEMYEGITEEEWNDNLQRKHSQN